MNAFMGLLMWPLGVLHHAGFSPSLSPGAGGSRGGRGERRRGRVQIHARPGVGARVPGEKGERLGGAL